MTGNKKKLTGWTGPRVNSRAGFCLHPDRSQARVGRVPGRPAGPVRVLKHCFYPSLYTIIIIIKKSIPYGFCTRHYSHIYKTLWIYCLFYHNLFLSLKFYFIIFDPNWRIINSDFLVKDQTKKIKIKKRQI